MALDSVLQIIIRARDLASGTISKVGGTVQGAMSAMAGVAKRVAKAFAVLAAGALAASFKIGKDFYFAIEKVGAIASATEDQTRQLSAAAREIGATTAFSATEAANAMYNLASAGLEVTQVMSAAEHAVKLAGATGGNMAQATKVMASTMRAYNLEAEAAVRVSDVYAMAISRSMFTLESLTEAMKIAGSTGAAMGWSMEQTTAAVAQFANLGLEGSMAGTNLRMAMTQLLKPTTDAEKIIKKLGFKVDELSPATNSFADIIEKLAETHLTAADAVEIFGTRAGANMFAIVNQAKEGTVDIRKFTEELEGSAGRAAEMYEQMMDTVEGQYAIFKSNIQELFITIFDTIRPLVKDVLKDLSTAVMSARNWIVDSADQIGRAMHMALTIIGTVATVVQRLGTITIGYAQDFFVVLKTILTGLMGFVQLAVQGIRLAFVKSMDFIVEKAKDLINKLDQFVMIPDSWFEAINSMNEKTNQWVANAEKAASEAVETMKVVGDEYQKGVGHLDDMIIKADEADEAIGEWLDKYHIGIEDAVDALNSLKKTQTEAAVIPPVDRNIDEVITKTDEAAAKVKSQWESVSQGIQSTMAQTGSAVLQGQKTLSEGLQAIGQQILSSLLTQLLSQAIAGIWASAAKYLGDPVTAPIGIAQATSSVAMLTGIIGGLAKMQKGGIITRPTAALIGEAGPEAVIPLEKFARFGKGGITNITLTGPFLGTPTEAMKYSRWIRRYLNKENAR